MLIDYLRYQAFSGRLSEFFQSGFREYVEPDHSTGQHLRFSPVWIQSCLHLFSDHHLINKHYSDLGFHDFATSILLDESRITRRSEQHEQSQFILGCPPPTYMYNDSDFAKLEIMIDVHPKFWDQYRESRSYDDTPIIYRRSSPARGNFSTGDRLVDRNQKKGSYGTLCGMFKTEDRRTFGLTCGHVTKDQGKVHLEYPWRLWWFELGSTLVPFGTTLHHTICGPDLNVGKITTQLDAALVACNRISGRSKLDPDIQQASPKPIFYVVQEEPVHFRGASRRRPTPARVSAITVRKSIDLLNDGNLQSVGDVLMLGHRERMYFAEPVSHPGDSGSAVRSGLSQSGPFPLNSDWYGMVLGGDEQSAYASYSESIWAWATDRLGTTNLSFYY